MTDDRDDFAEWRDSIESRMSTLETTVETQAEVRAGMDKDIRETQSEHTAALRGHTDILRGHTDILRDHTERLERLEVGQATVLVGVQTIFGLLDRDIDGGSESGDGNPGIPG